MNPSRVGSDPFVDASDHLPTLEAPETADRLAALFELFEAGMLALDEDGAVVAVDDGFCRLIDQDHDELLGATPPHPWWPDDQWDFFAAHLGKALELAAPRATFSGQFVRPDGTRLDVVGSTSVVVSEGGERLAVTVRDTETLRGALDTIVGERDQLIQELSETNAQLETALSSRVVLEQAKGRLVGELDISLDDAFEILHNHARNRNLRLHALATAVVARGAGALGEVG